MTDSPALFEALVDTVDALVWEVEYRSLRYLYVSEKLDLILGYEPEQWLLKPTYWPDHIHPQDRPWVVEKCQALSDTHRPIQLEYRMIGAGNRLTWVRDIVTLLKPELEPARLRGLRLNITEPKQASQMQAFARIVGASLDHQEIARRVLDELGRLLVYDTASFYLAPRDPRPEFLAVIGFDDEEMTVREGMRVLGQSELLRRMAHDHTPILCPDVSDLEGWVWVPGATHIRSFLAVPLFSRNEMIGALMLDHSQTSFFRQRDMEMVESLSPHVVAAMENAWVFEDTERRLAETSALLATGNAVSSSLDLNIVLSRVAHQMGQAIGATSAYISDWNGENKTTTVLAEHYGPTAIAEERVSDLGHTYQASEGFWQDPGWIDAHLPVVNHVEDAHLNAWEREHMERHGARSILFIPLVVKDQVIGYAELWDSGRRRDFTSEEVTLCQAMAQQAAIAMSNARLFEETRQRANELMVLHQVAQATGGLVDVDELINQTTEMISQTLYPDVFGFVFLDEELDRLVPHASYRGIPRNFYHALIPTEASIVGHVFQSGVPLIVGDVHQEPLYYEGVPQTLSEIAVPLIVRGDVVAVINVESPRLNAFSSNDARFLVTLAGQVATAIERARLHNTLQKQADDLANEVAERTSELQSERDRSVAVLESAGESIMLTDAQLNILYANLAMERQSGYAREELLGQSPRLLESKKTSRGTYQEMWSAVAEGIAWSGELVNQRKDGSSYDVAMTLTPIVDAEGQLTGFVGIQSDISRLKEVERLKDSFVSNVSHELRTPLTNIKMYLTLLERGRESKRQHYLNVLTYETDRLERLIQDLLNLSRLDTHAAPNVTASTDLGQVVRHQHAALKDRADAKGISLQTTLESDLLPAAVERDHLEQLVANLVGNAIAYTQDGGTVVLAAGNGELHGRSMIWFRVQDNGPGIVPEERSRLFDRFYRGGVAVSGNIPGTGLGLAICNEIVRRYGGMIDLESEPGKGTSFTAWLPAAATL